MKKKLKQKASQESQPTPSLDEVITISKDDGKAKVELKKPENVIEKPKITENKPAKKEKPFRMKKPESIIPTRRPRAAIVKEAKPRNQKKTKQPGLKTEAKKPESKKPEMKRPEVKAAIEEKFRPELFSMFDQDPVRQPEKKTFLDEKKLDLGQDKLALAEAALFLSSKPLMLDELAKIMGVSSLGYVKESLEKIKSHYEGRGIEVSNTANGWQMQVRSQYLNSVAHLAPYADLSEGPKRALALILYKEPLKQSELIKMQGNKVYDYLRVLEKMGMIKREPSGRTKILTLTKEFESYFGEDKDKVREQLRNELAIPNSEAISQNVQTKPKTSMKEAAKKLDLDIDFEEA